MNESEVTLDLVPEEKMLDSVPSPSPSSLEMMSEIKPTKRRKQSKPVRYGTTDEETDGPVAKLMKTDPDADAPNLPLTPPSLFHSHFMMSTPHQDDLDQGPPDEEEEDDDEDDASRGNGLNQNSLMMRRPNHLDEDEDEDEDEEEEEGTLNRVDCIECNLSFSSPMAYKAHMQQEHVLKMFERQFMFQLGASSQARGAGGDPMDPAQDEVNLNVLLGKQLLEKAMSSGPQNVRPGSRDSTSRSSTSSSNGHFGMDTSGNTINNNHQSAGNNPFPSMSRLFSGSSPMNPFLMPSGYQRDGSLIQPSRGGLGGSVPTSSGSFCIFNPEAYCELCNKEFCNKYFLKTHKANKHGIYTDGAIPSTGAPSTSTTSSGPIMSSCSTMSANHPVSPSNPLFTMTSSTGSNCTSTINSLTHLMSCTSPSASGPSVTPSSVLQGNSTGPVGSSSGPMVSPARRGSASSAPSSPPFSVSAAAAAASAFFPAGLSTSSGCTSPSGSGTTHSEGQVTAAQMAARIVGSINLEAFCEICQKEMCNKYFLKKHRQKIHGIVDPITSSGSPASSSSSNPGCSSMAMTSGSFGTNSQTTSSGNPILAIGYHLQTDSGSSSPRRKASPTPSLPGHNMGHNLFGLPSPNSSLNMMGSDSCGVGLNEMFNKYLPKSSGSLPSSGGSSHTNMHKGSAPKDLMFDLVQCMNLPPPLPLPPPPPPHVKGLSSPNQGSSSSSSHRPHSASMGHGLNGDGSLSKGMGLGKTGPLPVSPMALTMGSNGPIPNPSPKNYCNICNKELCNKYFMKTHMLKMHGINIDEQPAEAAVSSTIGGVTCDICQKELCSKYFLKVHKQNTHGIYEDNGSSKERGSSSRSDAHDRVQHGSSSGSNHPSNSPMSHGPPNSMHHHHGPNGTQSVPPSPNHALNMSLNLGGLGMGFAGMGTSSSVRGGPLGTNEDDASPSSIHAKGIDPKDTGNRYFSHYTEVCPACERRFKSIKWLKTHLHNDHPDLVALQAARGQMLLSHAMASQQGNRAGPPSPHMMSSLASLSALGNPGGNHPMFGGHPLDGMPLNLESLHHQRDMDLSKKRMTPPARSSPGSFTLPDSLDCSAWMKQILTAAACSNEADARDNRDRERDRDKERDRENRERDRDRDRDGDGEVRDSKEGLKQLPQQRSSPASSDKPNSYRRPGSQTRSPSRSPISSLLTDSMSEQEKSFMHSLSSSGLAPNGMQLPTHGSLPSVGSPNMPTAFAIPQKPTSGSFIMQPFLISQPHKGDSGTRPESGDEVNDLNEDGINGSRTNSPDGGETFVPSLVYLPVSRKIVQPVTVAFQLTPA